MNNTNSQQRLNAEIQKNKIKSYLTSTMISTVFIGLYGFFINLLFFFAGINVLEISFYVLLFFLVVGMNLWALMNDVSFYLLRLLGIISTLFMYSFIAYLLFNNNLPGIYANIFLAFTIGYIYLDEYTALLNHGFMAILSSVLVWGFPEIFGFENSNIYTLILVNVSLFILISILYFSSLFNIRKKNYNYKQLALSKDNEFKIINLIFSMSKEYFEEENNFDNYYDSLDQFFDAFSKKKGIQNHFNKRIDFIKKINESKDLDEILQEYPNIPETYIESLESLSVNKRNKLRLLAFKVSQAFDLDFKKRSSGIDLFSSLRHYDDQDEIKIIAFSAFYTYFRMNKLEKDAISDDHFITLLKNSDIENLIEPKNLDIYYKHKDIFNKIISDSLKNEGSI